MTTPVTVVSVTASPSAGAITGSVITITVTMSGAVILYAPSPPGYPLIVSNDLPGLSMNNGGIAYYDTVNSNSNTLIFNYTVQAGQNTTALAVLGFRQTSGVHYFSPIIKDTFGNYVNGSMFPITFDGLVIIAPT